MFENGVIFICPACAAEHAGVAVCIRDEDRLQEYAIRPILDCPGCGIKPEDVNDQHVIDFDVDQSRPID